MASVAQKAIAGAKLGQWSPFSKHRFLCLRIIERECDRRWPGSIMSQEIWRSSAPTPNLSPGQPAPPASVTLCHCSSMADLDEHLSWGKAVFICWFWHSRVFRYISCQMLIWRFGTSSEGLRKCGLSLASWKLKIELLHLLSYNHVNFFLCQGTDYPFWYKLVNILCKGYKAGNA